MTAHVVVIDTARAEPLDRHRWHCSCGALGMWRYGDHGARVARNGGVRHVAMLERGKR